MKITIVFDKKWMYGEKIKSKGSSTQTYLEEIPIDDPEDSWLHTGDIFAKKEEDDQWGFGLGEGSTYEGFRIVKKHITRRELLRKARIQSEEWRRRVKGRHKFFRLK